MTDLHESAPAEQVRPAEPRLRLRIDMRQYGIFAALAVVVVLFQILTDGKLILPLNVNNLIQQNAYVLILAVGMVIVIIAGHIDLSVGSVAAASGAIAALSMSELGLPGWGAVVLALVVGALFGAWQGYWIAFVGIPAFIVTLAGMLIFRGVTLVLLTRGTVSGLDPDFVAIGAGAIGKTGKPDLITLGIGVIAVIGLFASQLKGRAALRSLDLPLEPKASFWIRNLLISAAILVLAWLLANAKGTPIILIILGVVIVGYSFILNRSVFGRHVYAMGGNLFAAVMSGVKTKRVNFFIFVNMGVLAALAGIVATARADSAVAGAGQNFELDAIAAVFIGGAAVQGGVGTIGGAIIGGLLIGVLNQGLSILGVDAAWQQVIKGIVLLVAVAFDILSKRRPGSR